MQKGLIYEQIMPWIHSNKIFAPDKVCYTVNNISEITNYTIGFLDPIYEFH